MATWITRKERDQIVKELQIISATQMNVVESKIFPHLKYLDFLYLTFYILQIQMLAEKLGLLEYW